MNENAQVELIINSFKELFIDSIVTFLDEPLNSLNMHIIKYEHLYLQIDPKNCNINFLIINI